jgi:hypothetical protein
LGHYVSSGRLQPCPPHWLGPLSADFVAKVVDGFRKR